MDREGSMWRDPLDELIESLEATLPPSSGGGPYKILPDIADLEKVINPFLFGSIEDQRRIEKDPLFDKVMRQLAEQAARWNK
jgi:hypothetical protein